MPKKNQFTELEYNPTKTEQNNMASTILGGRNPANNHTFNPSPTINKPSSGGSGSTGGTNSPVNNGNSSDYYFQMILDVLNSQRAEAEKLREKQEQALRENDALIAQNNYESLYDNLTAISTAQELANKRAGTYLTASGFGSQGLMGTNFIRGLNAQANARAGARSDYNAAEIERQSNLISGLAGINADYADTINGIGNNELSIYQNARNNALNEENNQDLINENSFSSLIDTITLYAENGDTDRMNKVLQNYGFMDSNGKWTDSYNSLSSWQKGQIQSAMLGNLAGTNVSENDEYYGIANLPTNDDSTIYYYTKEGYRSSGLVRDKFKEEIQRLLLMYNLGELENGQTFKLTNGWGDYFYAEYIDGQLYTISKDRYDSSENKQKITYGYNDDADDENINSSSNNDNAPNTTTWLDFTFTRINDKETLDYLYKTFKNPQNGETINFGAGGMVLYQNNTWYRL